MTLPTIADIEAATLVAWPALEELRDRSWTARFARGYSKRANSIHSSDPTDDADAAKRLALLAEQYSARGLRPTFRQTPLAGPEIGAALDAAGWDHFEQSLVLSMELPKRMRLVSAATQYFEPQDPQWRQAQGAMAAYGEATMASLGTILDKMTAPTRGVLVYDDQQQPAGAALAVNANGTAVFLNVVVDPNKRGQGFGRAVMNAALNWTTKAGATQAAIQVLAENAQAVPLYRSLGFVDAYQYTYRRAPL